MLLQHSDDEEAEEYPMANALTSRRRIALSPLVEAVEPRFLPAVGLLTAASGHASPQREFAAIRKAVNHERFVSGDRELNKLYRATELTAIRNDLTIIGFFDKRGGHTRAEAGMPGIPAAPSFYGAVPMDQKLTQQQVLTQFQTDYQTAIANSLPDAVSLLKDEATLARNVAEIAAPLIAGPAGYMESLIVLNKNAPAIAESIQGI
jgi:hypothetical protein